MSELESSKNQIVQQLHKLCAHCANGLPHNCPLQRIASQVLEIRGVPLRVNDEFRGVLWS